MMKQASNGQLCDSMSMVEIALGDSLAVELAALTRATLVRIQAPQPMSVHDIHVPKVVAGEVIGNRVGSHYRARCRHQYLGGIVRWQIFPNHRHRFQVDRLDKGDRRFQAHLGSHPRELRLRCLRRFPLYRWGVPWDVPGIAWFMSCLPLF
jgi:hypothetical protein